MSTGDWRPKAACIGEDPELFHASESDSLSLGQARDICNRCTVRTSCLLAAYNEGDEHGLRAGLTSRQRKAFLRKANGNVARAVADALEDQVFLLRQIYQLYARPAAGGHVLWTDARHLINVRGATYTAHQVAWIAVRGMPPVGHVTRSCDVEGCVSEACLMGRPMRDAAEAARKQAAS